MNPLLTNPMLAHNVQIFGMGIFNLGEFVESMCGVAWSYHVTNFIQSDRRNHDYQIISILDPLPCHLSIHKHITFFFWCLHKHITSTNYLSEWSTQYTPKFKQNPPSITRTQIQISHWLQSPKPPTTTTIFNSAPKQNPKKHGQQQHRPLQLLDLRHQILLWQRPSSPLAPVCLSLFLWVTLLMVLKK